MNETTMCDDIDADSWDALPRTIRVGDFCKHCEFMCPHGRQIISQHNKMLEFQGFNPI